MGKSSLQSILLFLCQPNPNIITVTGHPPHPNDQGLVKSMNKLVKRVLNSALTECRLVGKNPNWTEVLGSVGASINAAARHGKNDTSAYTAVYGESYNRNISCTKEEVHHYMNHVVPELLLLP